MVLSHTLSGAFGAVPFAIGEVGLDLGQGTPSQARPPPRLRTGYGNVKRGRVLQEKRVGVRSGF